MRWCGDAARSSAPSLVRRETAPAPLVRCDAADRVSLPRRRTLVRVRGRGCDGEFERTDEPLDRYEDDCRRGRGVLEMIVLMSGLGDRAGSAGGGFSDSRRVGTGGGASAGGGGGARARLVLRERRERLWDSLRERAARMWRWSAWACESGFALPALSSSCRPGRSCMSMDARESEPAADGQRGARRESEGGMMSRTCSTSLSSMSESWMGETRLDRVVSTSPGSSSEMEYAMDGRLSG